MTISTKHCITIMFGDEDMFIKLPFIDQTCSQYTGED